MVAGVVPPLSKRYSQELRDLIGALLEVGCMGELHGALLSLVACACGLYGPRTQGQQGRAAPKAPSKSSTRAMRELHRLPHALCLAALRCAVQYAPEDRPTIHEVLAAPAVRAQLASLADQSWAGMKGLEAAQAQLEREVRLPTLAGFWREGGGGGKC